MSDPVLLDLKALRQDTARVRAALASRGDYDGPLDEILALDAESRRTQLECEDLQRRRNELSVAFQQAKRAGKDVTAVQHEAETVKARLETVEPELKALRGKIADRMAWIPNLPHPEVPVGRDETANAVVKEWGTPRQLDFTPKPHWELGEALGLFSVEGAARLAGSGFALFLGQGARLERALINFMIDLHVREHGYVEVWPPALALRDVMFGTGQVPKFEDDMYRLERDDLFLIPTAEVQLTNIHRGQTLAEADLPYRYVGFTHCFRREAGAAGRDTRGLIRLHQFDKVELVKLVHPDNSEIELATLVNEASTVLERLELPYRVLALCTGDMSFASARTFDIELHAPGVGRWLEVSSCSNCTDFQARRAEIKFKPADGGKAAYVHTLNGSGVALPRLVIAILENYQRADGTIAVPKALEPYVGCSVLECA